MTQDATSASSATPMSQSSQPRVSGDGWAVMATGTRLWGTVGAAGLMLRAPGPDGHPYVLLQHRAEWTSSPDTWALPGGARDVGESAEAAALRESVEETGIDPTALHIVRSQVTARLPLDYVIRRHHPSEFPDDPTITGRGGHHWVERRDTSVTEWTYTTVSAFADYRLETTCNWESYELRWVDERELTELPLMSAFRDSLPALRCQLEYRPEQRAAALVAEGDKPLRWVLPSS